MQCECSTSESGVRSVAELQWSRALQAQTPPPPRLQDHSQLRRGPAGYVELNGVPIVSHTGPRQGTVVLQTQDQMTRLTC